MATKKNTKFYSTFVFDDETMKKFLSQETYKAYIDHNKKGKPLTLKLADKIAVGMKNWALENGATHFTHWFQPLNGTTSEKHDSFLVPSGDSGKAIFSFSGKDLIRGEGDASSLPSGGLRATFEARGYTAWDSSSNAFIKDEVLCIPTAFCSFNGQALDKKTPLLRSMDALKNEVICFMRYFGKNVSDVVVNVGGEQEFFLIPKQDFKDREDLVMCGRTLFGNSPVKGQELEEHYYGCLRPTVSNYMKELDKELWELGIPAHTKHNEAAPSQHELAPIFSNANRAIDENLLIMEKMQLIASKYDLACLLHERPFEGINGSGKHCNWSVVAGKTNMLDIGKSQDDLVRFLAFLSCVVAAVDEYQELLRASVASAGNDCRLGGNEAPPAIISIFLGDALVDIIKQVMYQKSFSKTHDSKMDLGASVLPQIMRDASDRNRTSPFAFSANKFEFRMPGSQQNLSDCVMTLNTAIAKALNDFNKKLEAAPNYVKDSDKFNSHVISCASWNFKQHQRIIFNGDGYSESWQDEAERRGLANHKNTAEALRCLTDKKSVALFNNFGVLTPDELHSRYTIYLGIYNKLINIESKLMHRMAFRTYLPAINDYAGYLATEINQMSKAIAKPNLKSQKRDLRILLKHIQQINDSLKELDSVCDNAKRLKDEQKRADYNAEKVIPVMRELRRAVDNMEHIVPRDFWPVPSYNNMLFYV